MRDSMRLLGTLRRHRAVRLAIIGALLGLVVLALLRAFGALQLQDETWARIQRQGLLRVGMDASYPPFENVDGEGHFSGFDVDLAQALAARWGTQVEFINVHFDGLYDALRVARFDLIISALPYDRTMTRDVAYSQSYFNAGQVLVARDGGRPLRSFADLDGRVVAVELGTEAHQLARKLARDKGLAVQVVPLREPDAVLEMVRTGSADALICDRVAALGYLQRDAALRIVSEPLTQQPYVVAALPEAPLLMQEVNSALQAWQEDGLLAELQRRWFH